MSCFFSLKKTNKKLFAIFLFRWDLLPLISSALLIKTLLVLEKRANRTTGLRFPSSRPDIRFFMHDGSSRLCRTPLASEPRGRLT